MSAQTSFPSDSNRIGETPARTARVSPKTAQLGPAISAEVEALLNDMSQARELAADYQRALAGKSNDYAELKQVLEKTEGDLAHLQTLIAGLREERHRLANEAMKVEALELRIGRIAKQRDELLIENEALRRSLTGPIGYTIDRPVK